MTRTVPAAGAAVLALTAVVCGGRRQGTILVASGHVEATDVRISTKVAGRLERLALDEGDVVTRGQELAAIDTTDLGLALRQVKADRSQAAAELGLRVAGPRKEDIAEAGAQVRALESDLDGAQRDLDRMQGLLDRGSGTTKGRDDAGRAATRWRSDWKRRASRSRARTRGAGPRRSKPRVRACRRRRADRPARAADPDATMTSPVRGCRHGEDRGARRAARGRARASAS